MGTRGGGKRPKQMTASFVWCSWLRVITLVLSFSPQFTKSVNWWTACDTVLVLELMTDELLACLLSAFMSDSYSRTTFHTLAFLPWSLLTHETHEAYKLVSSIVTIVSLKRCNKIVNSNGECPNNYLYKLSTTATMTLKSYMCFHNWCILVIRTIRLGDR